jgi:hypothetical protein
VSSNAYKRRLEGLRPWTEGWHSGYSAPSSEFAALSAPEIDHCPWCGEGDTGGDFCDHRCRREYWADCKREMPHEVTP